MSLPPEESMTSASRAYLRSLRPEKRGPAREWYAVDEGEFRMRVGTTLDELSSRVHRLTVLVLLAAVASPLSAIAGPDAWALVRAIARAIAGGG